MADKKEKPKGLRYNKDKRKWCLVDFPSLEPMIEVLEFGAKKYSPDNWKGGMPRRELLESLMRHVAAYISGEDTDPESGLSHIGHIQCNAMFLAYNHKHHPKFDDRILTDLSHEEETAKREEEANKA